MQGVAQPVKPVPWLRVQPFPVDHQQGAPHLLRYEPLRPGPPNLLHVRGRCEPPRIREYGHIKYTHTLTRYACCLLCFVSPE